MPSPTAALPDPPAPPLHVAGATVAFETITSAAKPLIQAAMAKLSPQSSRRRFFTVRHRLSDDELERFTVLDGWDRYAIGAVARHGDGRVEGVGVARYVRLADRPDAAEAAVLVVDAWQGHGIGKRLLRTLAQAASARGIATLRGVVLHDNDPMLALLARYAPSVARIHAGDHFDVEVGLAPAMLAVP
jgi:GNAT superfamily N-acetyltransferase